MKWGTSHYYMGECKSNTIGYMNMEKLVYGGLREVYFEKYL